MNTVEEVFTGIYKIQVPLPNNPLKMLNSYLIRGREKSLLIDTGFNQQECWQALTQGLAHLGVPLDQLDVFVTHLHADHCGLVSNIAIPGKTTVWGSAGDSKAINQMSAAPVLGSTLDSMISHGCDPKMLSDLTTSHPSIKYAPSSAVAFSIAKEGDVLHYGDHELNVLSTPGHTPDHLVLYVPAQKILFSGDLILGDITPNISHWNGMNDALGAYLASLDKIAQFDIECTLPGHRSVVHHTQERITSLKHHHEQRLNEVRQILSAQPMCAAQVAPLMTWNMRYATWEQFPAPQRWFATNEALAHLEHLVATAAAKTQMRDGIVYFHLLP